MPLYESLIPLVRLHAHENKKMNRPTHLAVRLTHMPTCRTAQTSLVDPRQTLGLVSIARHQLAKVKNQHHVHLFQRRCCPVWSETRATSELRVHLRTLPSCFHQQRHASRVP